MNVGMNLPVMVPNLDRARILEWSRRIDAGPFSTLALGERIAFPNPEVMITAAAAGAVTERVRLALTVVVLPMHSAALTAKQVATLDVLSGGRVTLGVGVGAREEDFRAVGTRCAPHRLAQLEEQVGIMRKVWAGERVAPDLPPIGPRPVQAGGPEILAGSLQSESIRRAARWADGICGFSFGPSKIELAWAFDAARQAWKQAGRASAPRLVPSCWFALGGSAREQMDRYLDRYLGFMGPDAARQIAPTCRAVSPRVLKDVIREVADLGADELLLVPTTLDPGEVDRVADVIG